MARPPANTGQDRRVAHNLYLRSKVKTAPTRSAIESPCLPCCCTEYDRGWSSQAPGLLCTHSIRTYRISAVCSRYRLTDEAVRVAFGLLPFGAKDTKLTKSTYKAH